MKVKEEFWVDVERVIEVLAVEQRDIVGADLNGHIGTSGEGVENTWNFWIRKGKCRRTKGAGLFVSFDLTIANTFFRKREDHYITYKRGGNKAQVDFMMYRFNLVEIKNCKVIPVDHVAPQHRLVVMDLNARNPRGGNKNYKKIRWTGLKYPKKQRQEFKTKVLNRLTTTEQRVQDC